MADVFHLKRGDTTPVLERTLLNPDGTAHDLTGADNVFLHIELDDGTELSRTMSITDAANGVVQYSWLASDWDAGNLVVGIHQMEYEVVAGTDRASFPNDGNDFLQVAADIADSP